jgi:RNA recognition motif-containing protein
MGKELYVGSLSYDTTEYDLEKLFSVSGRVTSIHLITDLKTGQFKGCGYVRMSTEAEAKDAIQSLDGALLIDRRITVSMANPQKQKPVAGGYKGKSGGSKPGGSARPSFPGKPGATRAAGKKPGFTAPASKAGSSKPGPRGGSNRAK